MRRVCPHGVCRYLQKLLPKSCLAACGGASNCSLALGGWDWDLSQRGLGLLLVGPRPKEAKYGLWGFFQP